MTNKFKTTIIEVYITQTFGLEIQDTLYMAFGKQWQLFAGSVTIPT